MELRNTKRLTAALDAAAAGIAQGFFRLALHAIQLRLPQQAIVFHALFSNLSLAKKLASDTAPLA